MASASNVLNNGGADPRAGSKLCNNSIPMNSAAIANAGGEAGCQHRAVPPPREPDPSRYELPDRDRADEHGLVAVGGDLAPGTLLAAYRRGLFPMNVGRRLGWWSPDPRGVLPLDGFRTHQSLRRAIGRFEIRINSSFEAVMRACADLARPHGWIDDAFIAAYCELHALGWAHSVETWRDATLVGGLYGVRIGGLFAGESMFHRQTDASKVALRATCDLLRLDSAAVFDVQWTTPHLSSLGAIEIPRRRYMQLLAAAIAS
ncbi:MAG: leucyl/phenylalanyl-tRNA--protein transferase [Actinomycetota bacterium]